MLIKLFKYLLGIFTFLGFVMLLSLSYFSINLKENHIDDIIEQTSYTGTYVHNINYIDNIYTESKDNFTVSEEGKNINIDLKKGLYIVSLGDLTKKYKINGESFLIDIKLPGDIFIGNEGNYITIFSINSSFSINFIDKNKKFVNNIFLYPHEIYKFNPRFIGISINKKSDIYRLKTINKLSSKPYIKTKLINLDKIFSSNIFSKESNIVFENYIQNKKLEISNNDLVLNRIKALQIVDFPFADLIGKHKKYFLNNFKKSIYLQNRIYNNLVILFKNNAFDIEKVKETTDLLNELKTIDTKAYNNVNSFINNIYKLIIYQNDINDYQRLRVFLKLKQNKNNIVELVNFLNLKKIYFSYDFGSSKGFKANFNNFLKTYLKQSGITKKDEMYSLNDKDVLKQVESFVFYIKEYINNHLFLDNLDNFKVETEILAKYLPLNKMIYFSGNVQNFKIRTALKENRRLLERLEKFLRKNFFLEKRDESGLLVLKGGTNFDSDTFMLFKKQIENIFNLYSDYKDNLSNNDKEDIKVYEKLYKITKEEFIAFSNPSKYKLEYNKKLSDLHNIEGVGVKKNIKYTVEDVRKYLSQFNNFYYGNIKKSKNKFIIDGISFNGKDYIFHFEPMDHYMDVYDTNNKFLFSFGSLDEVKELWDERMKGASDEDKYKYDFKNFFYLKFNSYNDNKKKLTQEEICAELGMIVDPKDNTQCIDRQEDSQVILLLKQKLINEEFNILKSFFYVDYNNIFVEQSTKEKYKIILKNIKTIINIKSNNDDKRYNLNFNSYYNYYNHHFYNISFSIEQDKRKLFDGASIKFSKFDKVKIDKLKDKLEGFFKKINWIRSVFNTLRSKMILNNLEINYLSNGRTLISYNNHNNKKVIISLENNKIISIIVNNSNILKRNINIEGLGDYLDKIE